MSDGVLLASVVKIDFLGGFSAVTSKDFVSSDRRCAATFPNNPPRSVFIKFDESLSESFEPKLSLRYEWFVVGFGDLIVVLVLFVVMIVFEPFGGRSGRSFVGVAKI